MFERFYNTIYPVIAWNVWGVGSVLAVNSDKSIAFHSNLVLNSSKQGNVYKYSVHVSIVVNIFTTVPQLCTHVY